MVQELYEQLKDDVEEVKIAKVNNDYFIDSLGNVYSRPRKGAAGGIVPKRLLLGYFSVRIFIGGKMRTKRLHRLLAEAFIPNTKKYPQINHKDGDKTNNALSNLEWCNMSQNAEHAWRIGLKPLSDLGELYITRYKRSNTFRVMVRERGNQSNFRYGEFRTLGEAIRSRDKWVKEIKKPLDQLTQ